MRVKMSYRKFIVKQVYAISSNVRSLFIVMYKFAEDSVIELRFMIQKINDLYNTNIDLAIYHIKSGNINDAIFRLKIVRLFSKNQDKACHLLAWCYLLKGNKKEAIRYASLGAKEDRGILMRFLEDNQNGEEIPCEIMEMYYSFAESRFTSTLTSFLEDSLQKLGDIGDNCKILDLDVGHDLGVKLTQIINISNCSVDGVVNKDLVENVISRDICIHHGEVKRFLQQCEKRYDLIVSLNNLRFSRNISEYFMLIHNVISNDGRFVLLLKTSDVTSINSSSCRFEYNFNDIEAELHIVGLKILYTQELIIDKSNKYTIFLTGK